MTKLDPKVVTLQELVDNARAGRAPLVAHDLDAIVRAEDSGLIGRLVDHLDDDMFRVLAKVVCDMVKLAAGQGPKPDTIPELPPGPGADPRDIGRYNLSLLAEWQLIMGCYGASATEIVVDSAMWLSLLSVADDAGITYYMDRRGLRWLAVASDCRVILEPDEARPTLDTHRELEVKVGTLIADVARLEAKVAALSGYGCMACDECDSPYDANIEDSCPVCRERASMHSPERDNVVQLRGGQDAAKDDE